MSNSEVEAMDEEPTAGTGGASAALVGFLLLAIAVGTVTLFLANTAGI